MKVRTSLIAHIQAFQHVFEYGPHPHYRYIKNYKFKNEVEIQVIKSSETRDE